MQRDTKKERMEEDYRTSCVKEVELKKFIQLPDCDIETNIWGYYL